jgi:hypothetical protein
MTTVEEALPCRWPHTCNNHSGHLAECPADNRPAVQALLAERDARIAELKAENDALRMIAAKVMPCHYCGVSEIARCPHGFPGCSLADDIVIGEMELAQALQSARAERDAIRAQTIEECAKKLQSMGPILGLGRGGHEALADEIRALLPGPDMSRRNIDAREGG